MELWFGLAVIGALFAGASNFCFKLAAVRGYSAELFSLYASIVGSFLPFFIALILGEDVWNPSFLLLGIFCAGLLAAVTGLGKVYALRHIDSTIYFPLFKLLAPALAIVAGVFMFSETFSIFEWFGMCLGLFVPLMLITRSEDRRQNNLLRGLMWVLITGVFSAVVAVVNKFAIDSGLSPVVTLTYLTFGIFSGTLLIMMFGRKGESVWNQLSIGSNKALVCIAAARGALISISVLATLNAFYYGGTLAVVQTVHSMYILIPIVLSIIFYNEHWNLQKVAAIVLSVAALALLG